MLNDMNAGNNTRPLYIGNRDGGICVKGCKLRISVIGPPAIGEHSFIFWLYPTNLIPLRHKNLLAFFLLKLNLF
jgi:hypothetical protein